MAMFNSYVELPAICNWYTFAESPCTQLYSQSLSPRTAECDASLICPLCTTTWKSEWPLDDFQLQPSQVLNATLRLHVAARFSRHNSSLFIPIHYYSSLVQFVDFVGFDFLRKNIAAATLAPLWYAGRKRNRPEIGYEGPSPRYPPVSSNMAGNGKWTIEISDFPILKPFKTSSQWPGIFMDFPCFMTPEGIPTDGRSPPSSLYVAATAACFGAV